MKWLAFGFILGWSVSTFAADAKATAGGSRSRVIDFDSSVVEGINRRPYDSLNQVHDGRGRKDRPHLYRKRSGFTSDTRETLSELRFVQ